MAAHGQMQSQHGILRIGFVSLLSVKQTSLSLMFNANSVSLCSPLGCPVPITGQHPPVTRERAERGADLLLLRLPSTV